MTPKIYSTQTGMPSTHKPWTGSHTVTFTIGFILGLVINHYAHSCVTACFWMDLLPGYKHTQLFAGRQKMECGEELSLVEYFVCSSKPFWALDMVRKL